MTKSITLTEPVISTPVIKNPSTIREKDWIAVEEPLQIFIAQNNGENRVLSITMRTPGRDRQLITGLLYNESIIKSTDQILSIEKSLDNNIPQNNQWQVTLDENTSFDWTLHQRHLVVNSACGVCGKTSLQALELKNPPDISDQLLTVAAEVIHHLSVTSLQQQNGFEQTGGMHACALFNAEGELLTVEEDVGRHNAMDKLVGHEFEQGNLPAKNCILWVSGRCSFELVQKAIMAGVPVMVSVGAVSSLAVQTAQKFGLTLIGFSRDNRFNIYHGAWRIKEH